MERDKLLGTMDAKVWTDEFMATKARLGNKEFDHAMMLSWFANAIMAGFDEANRRAQRALDVEREKVQFGSCEACWNLAWVLCRDDEPNAVPMKCANGTTYWRCDYCRHKQQLATLQAQLADRDAMILQMGEQAAVLAKENMAVKAQLRQVEGERDAADAELHRDMVEYCQFAHEIALPGTRLPEQVDDSISFGKLKDVVNAIVASRDTLRQLVEALPVVDGRMDVECGACYYIRSFVAGQYGVVCGLITEPSTAMAIKTLLEYRATQAAQDAGKEDVSHE